jgi:tRNA pseudouridine(55) synthase
MSGRHRQDDPTLHGVLLVDKPAGPTSHDVVGWVRWVLGVRRVGHAGTLDPAATGLLVVAVGAATKLTPYLTGQDKRYRARIVLGASTTTADAEGSVVDEAPCPPGLEDRVPAALVALAAVRSLPPPAYSAIHVEGRRAHERARAGEVVVLEARPMAVLDHALLAVERHHDRVAVEVDLLVSKGTYVRSLAEALGRLLGVPAHLARLHRTHSGRLGLAHPNALGGLVAQAEPRPTLGSPPAAGPRWRLHLCEPAAPPAGDHAPPTMERSAAAAELRARLLAPSEVVPLPVLRLPDDACGRRAMEALASGRALPWPRAGLAEPSASAAEPDADERVAVAPVAGEGLVVARVDRRVAAGGDPTKALLRPERVVVPPPTHP